MNEPGLVNRLLANLEQDKWLPECASIRRGRPGWAEPEVWFRIIHVTLEDAACSTAYREQTIEVTLGPKGAFENGNIGTLTRRVPANRVVERRPAAQMTATRSFGA